MFTQNRSPLETETALYILGTKPSAVLSNLKFLEQWQCTVAELN